MNDFVYLEDYELLKSNERIQKLLENPIFEKDVWHLQTDLGLDIDEYKGIYTVNFSAFIQSWFKLLVKLFTLVTISKSKFKPQTSIKRVGCLRKCSLFMEKRHVYSLQQIGNEMYEEYNQYLEQAGLSPSSINAHLSALRFFLDTCRIEKWLNVNTYWFEGKCSANDYPTNEGIVYIPEEVWNQLDQNLHFLPDPLQRMVLIIRSLALRVGELCTLPFSCLRNRDGQWRLRFLTEKEDVEDEMPLVAPELVVVIQEQQNYIRENLGDDYPYLFCTNELQGPRSTGIKGKGDALLFQPKPSLMKGNSFNKWLNRLAKKCNIRSKDGELWHFCSHQFRRTVATAMANSGIRDLIIQRYLRHRSPQMQKYYIHLLKQVLGEEFEQLMREKKYVDISGKVVTSYTPQHPITELIRRRMHQITTQYGECHRAVLQAPCQTVNACWRCSEWRTSLDDLPFLHEDLERVEEELEIAAQMGMIRQQKGLKGDRDTLLVRIQGLEVLNA